MGRTNTSWWRPDDTVAVIWFVIYAVASLVFSFSDSKLLVCVPVIVMMISCIRMHAITWDQSEGSSGKLMPAGKVLCAMCGGTACIVAMYLVISSH